MPDVVIVAKNMREDMECEQFMQAAVQESEHFKCLKSIEVWQSAVNNTKAVSYTHLTLPTICSV